MIDNKESFVKNITGNINDYSDIIIKKSSNSHFRFFLRLGVGFLLVQKLIIPYMLHDTFVILNRNKLILIYVLTFIIGIIIFLLSEAINKILMYLFR